MRPWPALLAGFLAIASATPALALKEWYDYYLDARDRLIPDKRWDDALAALREAERLKPASALHEQLYGLQFEDYVPYFYAGVCYLGKHDYDSAQRMFNIEEAAGAIKRSESLYQKLREIRKQAADLQNEKVAEKLRDEENRLIREAQDLYKARKFDDALARLALAQAGASALDQGRQQQIRDLTEKVRNEQRESLAAEARAKRIETALGEGHRLLADGHPTEATVQFDEVLALDPKNTGALDGRREAEARILASTTKQSREAALKLGKTLLDQNKYEEALRPLSDAAADPEDREAQDLLQRARKVVEALREQKDLAARIEKVMAQGEADLAKRLYPEATVAFGSVLQMDPSNVKAKERLAEAERFTGSLLLGKWLPNQKPILNFFEPRSLDIFGPTVAFIGVATDDRGVAGIDFAGEGKVFDHLTPPPLAEPGEPPRSVPFERTFPLKPGANDFTVTTVDDMGLVAERRFRVIRHLRFFETSAFLPSALGAALGLISLGLLAQHLRQRRALRRRFNPYIAGAPVLDDDMFFGRQRLMSRIMNVLHHNSLMITGERRIGKTTFLYHLGKALSADEATDYKFFPIFTDLQGVPESAFFQAVAGDIVDALSLSKETLGSLRLGAGKGSYDGRDFSHDLQRIIEELKTRTTKKVKLALLIDEVDVLNAYSERINQRLRSIFMKTFAEHLVAIMSGVGIKRTWKSEGSPWYNFFDEVELQALAPEEAEALIRMPVEGYFRYAPEAVDAILRYSGLKPYVIQKFCIHAINRILELGRTTVTASDVEAVREVAEGEDFERPAISRPRAALGGSASSVAD